MVLAPLTQGNRRPQVPTMSVPARVHEKLYASQAFCLFDWLFFVGYGDFLLIKLHCFHIEINTSMQDKMNWPLFSSAEMTRNVALFFIHCEWGFRIIKWGQRGLIFF